MPLIDVTQVLLDPVVAGEAFEVVRREEVVNAYGESVLTTIRLPATGSVQPTGANSLTRLDAFQTQAKTLRVITTFRLRGASKERASGDSYQPDLVYWRGDYFIVTELEDFTQYGAGMVQANCTSTDFVDDAPYQLAPQVGRLDFSQANNSGLAGGIGCS